MMELEYMQRAKMYMDKLALRIDPITDRPLPGDTALNQVSFSGALPMCPMCWDGS